MQSQPLSMSVIRLASHDIGEMQAKLQQVEVRIRDTHQRQLEAAQVGDTEEADKQRTTLSRQVAAYKKGRAYVEQVLSARRLVAEAQAQGSSQPHDPSINPGTSQNQNPVSGMDHSSPNIDLNSVASASTGPAMNAARLQAFDPAATQTLPQVSLGDVCVHDAPDLRVAAFGRSTRPTAANFGWL